jgi:hypothetical protein
MKTGITITEATEHCAFLTNTNGYDVAFLRRIVPQGHPDIPEAEMLTEEQWQALIDQIAAALAPVPATKKFTIWICEANGTGSHYVTLIEAEDIETAKAEALAECSREWSDGTSEDPSYPVEDLHVLGVAEGDVTLLEWADTIF